MQWVDVAGVPGAGKSTICNPLWPFRLRLGDDRDPPPVDWQPFIDEITRLLGLIRTHATSPTFGQLNRRVMRRMVAVAQTPERVRLWRDFGKVRQGPYLQTGFVQPGLSFAWRLNEVGADVDEIRRYLELMPVSLGVAFLEADEASLRDRNRSRTARQDYTLTIPLFTQAIRIAKEVLRARGVRVAEIDVQRQSIYESRAALVAFAAAARSRPSTMPVYSGQRGLGRAPVWWKRGLVWAMSRAGSGHSTSATRSKDQPTSGSQAG
jgi:hypothetical protein